MYERKFKQEYKYVVEIIIIFNGTRIDKLKVKFLLILLTAVYYCFFYTCTTVHE